MKIKWNLTFSFCVYDLLLKIDFLRSELSCGGSTILYRDERACSGGGVELS